MKLQGIPPGSYYVYPLFAGGQQANRGGVGGAYYSARISVEVIDRNVTESAEFLAKYETRGHAVTVDAGARLSDVALDLISQ